MASRASVTRPDVWWVVPAFSITPKSTFFGLDKSSAHCFTIDKRVYRALMTSQVQKAIPLSENKKQVSVLFQIGGRRFPAEIRLVNQNRAKPRKASAELYPPRVVFQFQWKKFPETVQAIHSLFADDIELMHEGHPASHRAVFNHLGGKEFLVRRMLHEDEPVETKLPTVRAARNTSPAVKKQDERHDDSKVRIVLTETMLSKHAIDATIQVREFLKRESLVDFDSIGQGQEHKVTLNGTLVNTRTESEGNVAVQCGFYRPNSGKGDPRFWISKLATYAKADNVLVLEKGGEGGLFLTLMIDDDSTQASGLRKPTFSDELLGVALKKIDQGETDAEIERVLGIPTRRLRELRDTNNRPRSAGGSNRYSIDDHNEVITLMYSGCSLQKIVEETGVPKDTVLRWRKDAVEEGFPLPEFE